MHCVTLGLGHTWAHLDWGPLGLGHTWIGTHLDWVTLGLGHTWIGSHLDLGTLGLGHTWIGSHLDCDDQCCLCGISGYKRTNNLLRIWNWD